MAAIVLLSAASSAGCGKVTLDSPAVPVDAQVLVGDAGPGEHDARPASDAQPAADARPASDAPPDQGVPCVDGDAQRQDPATGACYMLFETTRLSWSEALAACQALDPPAHLATVITAEEHALTVELARAINVWLGAHDLVDQGAEEGVFQWVTGEPMAFEVFADGEPNNGGGDGPDEDCLLLILNDASRPQSWDDRQCNSQHAFLCERE